MEIVKYRGRCYTVTRPVDKEGERLLTPQKQKIAKLYFYKGMSSKDIARILNVDVTLLEIWYSDIAKSENISKAVKSFNQGRSRKIIATNTVTGEEIIYPSLSACGRSLGCLASTVRNKILQGKKYKHWKFRYAED